MKTFEKKPSYAEQLKDPRWQRKRLEILERDNWLCRKCGSTEKTLHVHHGYYEKGLMAWEYPSETLHAVCEDCHEIVQAEMVELQRDLATMPFHTHMTILGFMRTYRMRYSMGEQPPLMDASLLYGFALLYKIPFKALEILFDQKGSLTKEDLELYSR